MSVERKRGWFEIVSVSAALQDRVPRTPWYLHAFDACLATVEAIPRTALSLVVALAPAILVLAVLGAAGAFGK